jgi:hypothetical protein
MATIFLAIVSPPQTLLEERTAARWQGDRVVQEGDISEFIGLGGVSSTGGAFAF